MHTETNTLIQGCKNTIIPEDTEIIGDWAFAYCEGLTGVVIPNSVTEIGEYAFGFCNGLTALDLGTGVQTIEGYAFENCEGLTEITSLAMTAPTIQRDTFRNVKTGGTLTVPNGATGYDTWMSPYSYYLGEYNWTIQYSDDL